MKMEKMFVTFLSPGTFVHEATEKKIESWDVSKAKEMAVAIHERHGARPFGFYFTTRGRTKDDLDSKEIRRSGTYYLGGRILTAKDVEQGSILHSNMINNGIEKVIENTNSWKVTVTFEKGDELLEFEGFDRAKTH